MEVTLAQGIWITIMAFICGIDFSLEAFFWFRPIIAAFFTGIILGDVQLGLAAGAITELAYVGLLTIGGTVPPNPLMAGIMTVIIAYTTGSSPEAALALSLPFALLMQWINIFYHSAFSVFLVPVLDRKAAEADTNGFTRAVMLGAIIVGLTYAVVTFVSAYVAQEPIARFVTSFPTWFVHGFEICGQLLPGVGLALLLRTMLTGDNAPFLFIGFLMATYLELGNVLPVAIAGTVAAVLVYKSEKKSAQLRTEGGGPDEGI